MASADHVKAGPKGRSEALGLDLIEHAIKLL